MTRASLSTALRTELTGLDVRVVLLLKIDFTAGAVLTCTGNGPVTFNGDTYQPDGTLLGQSGVEERTGKPPAANFVLAPVGTLKTRVEAGGYRRTPVYFYEAVLDADHQIISAFLLGSYRIGKFIVQRSRDTFTYQMNCSTDLEDGYRAHPVYPSDTMQQLRYSGDSYFRGASAIRGYEFEWGGKSYKTSGVPGRTGCVSVDEEIDGVRAGDIKTGDTLRVADPLTLDEGRADVLYSSLALMPGVRVTTETGRTLVCSTSAPIATDTDMVRAKHLLNYAVLIEGGQYERVTAVESLGEIPVQHIYVSEQCFWVNGFLHHNKRPTPVGGKNLPAGGSGGGASPGFGFDRNFRFS